MARGKKTAKQSAIQSEYRRARKNYLARVRYLESLGYMVNREKLVQKPTKASINKLKKLNTKTLKKKSKLVDVETGELYTTKSKKRTTVEKKNRARKKFVEDIKKAIKEYGTEGRTNFFMLKPEETVTYEPPTIETTASRVDVLIDNWYRTIEDLYHPKIRQVLIDRTNELVAEDREAFARTLSENKFLLPDIRQYNEEVINAIFTNIKQIMQSDRVNGRVEKFLDESNIIESEADY